MIHDVSGDPEDPRPMCCADGCRCGQAIGQRLAAVLADVAEGMVALGQAAERAAAAVPQLPAGEQS